MYHDERWWLAYVLKIDLEKHEIKVSILYPNGAAHSFKYPDILWISMSDFLTIVDPRLNSSYMVTQKESQIATEKLYVIMMKK